MFRSLFANYTSVIFFFQLIFGQCIDFAITTSSLSQPVVKLVFILDETQRKDLKPAFDNFLKEAVNSSFLNVKGITVEWKIKDSQESTWRKIKQNIIEQNASAVVSFLKPWRNQVLVNALSKSVVPVIGMESLTEELYSSKKEGALYLSMLPSEALHARVLKDLMLEFHESRFSCITTESSRDDSLLSYLSQYYANNGHQAAAPRCIILSQNTLLEELSASLAAISASGVRLIVVHCTNDESTAIIAFVRKLSFKILRGEFVWIFTDKAVGKEARAFPEGSIGVRKDQNTGNDRMLELYTGLLNDSVKLFVAGLERSLAGLSHSTRLKCLGGELFTTYKKRLYREMTSYSFYGQTGTVQFSPNGERTSFKFTIVKTIRAPQGGLHWYTMGHACPELAPDYGPHIFEPFLPRDLPRPRHLRIVSINHEPFTVIHDADFNSRLGTSCPADTVPCTPLSSSDKHPPSALIHTSMWKPSHNSAKIRCCYGLMIDILVRLQEIEEFTFDLYLVADGKYGSVDPETKEMNGMIGDVYRGFADLAIGLITITEQRSEYVGFTTPYMDTALTFLVKRTKSKNKNFVESISDMRLMKSFSMQLWLMCLAAFCTVAVSVWVIEKLYYYQNHKSAYLLPFEFMMYVYGNIFHVPLTKIEAKTYSVPCVMVVANFAGLVLVSSYTVNLLASLITVEEVKIVSGIADGKLENPPEGFTFGTIKDTSTEDFFRKSQSSRLRKIYENMKKYNVETFAEGIKKVRTGELTAFISETDGGEDDPNCELKEDGLAFELPGLAFALPKNSSWNHQISQAIHKLKAQDGISDIFRKWTTSRCTSSQQTVVAHKMGLDEFGGFLFNTAMISVGCFFILLAEIIVYRRITRTRQSFSPQQNGFALNAFTLPESSSMSSILNN